MIHTSKRMTDTSSRVGWEYLSGTYDLINTSSSSSPHDDSVNELPRELPDELPPYDESPTREPERESPGWNPSLDYREPVVNKGSSSQVVYVKPRAGEAPQWCRMLGGDVEEHYLAQMRENERKERQAKQDRFDRFNST